MGRSCEQWYLSAMGLATFGRSLIKTSGRQTVSLRNCVDRKTVTDIDVSGRIKCIRGTCVNHEISIDGDQNNVE